MRVFAWTLGLLGICLILSGCYSVGGAGFDEKIYGYQPSLKVVQPKPAPAVTPSRPLADAVVEAVPLETEPWQAAATETPAANNITASTVPTVAPAAANTIAPVETTTTDAPPAEDIAEVITSIGKMESNSTKRHLYIAIAKRADITQDQQIQLVDAVFKNLFSESAIEDVLITLIQNPQITDACKDAIAKRLNNFISESSKTRVRAALTGK
jgi:hypothetical protein